MEVFHRLSNGCKLGAPLALRLAVQLQQPLVLLLQVLCDGLGFTAECN